MPSLDIVTFRSSFTDILGSSRVHSTFYGSTSDLCAFAKQKTLPCSWSGCVRIPRKESSCAGHLEMQHPFIVSAVATVEPNYLVLSEDGCTQTSDSAQEANSDSKMLDSSIEESSELDEKEKLRRLKISKSNKGNVPWNKGKKHSAETLQRIRERTRLAMRDPKIRMKLVELGHAQSNETRVKIGLGVKRGWEVRHARLRIQEKCCLEWRNLIAEASRKGNPGEEELKWDSFEILDKQLESEWLETIKRRNSKTSLPNGKNAPKSLEQRRKIAKAISAKWDDPEYRNRVCAALAKYHGTTIRSERKSRKKPTQETPSVRRGTRMRTATEKYSSARAGRNLGKVGPTRKRNTPSYKDPLADSKLEMIKKIREERAVIDTRKRETMERAKLLIAEAEKAAKALEVAARKSALAQVSLTETRKLIAEATRTIQSIETGHPTLLSKEKYVSLNSNHFHEELETTDMSSSPLMREVNGAHAISSSRNRSTNDLNINSHPLKKSVNGTKSVPVFQNVERGEDYFLPQLHHGYPGNQLSMTDRLVASPKINGAEGELTGVLHAREAHRSSSDTPKKKWVCGKLVEVSED